MTEPGGGAGPGGGGHRGLWHEGRTPPLPGGGDRRLGRRPGGVPGALPPHAGGHRLAFVLVQHLSPRHETLHPRAAGAADADAGAQVEDETRDRGEPDLRHAAARHADHRRLRALRLEAAAAPRPRARPIDQLLPLAGRGPGATRPSASSSPAPAPTAPWAQGDQGARRPDPGPGSRARRATTACRAAPSLTGAGRPRAAGRADAGPADRAPRRGCGTGRGAAPSGSARRSRAISARSARSCAARPATTSATTSRAPWCAASAAACRCCGPLRSYAYVESLRQDPNEVEQLFRDLLIGVTHFFRDPEAFELLAAKVIPRLFEGKDADGTVRVWVARLRHRRGGLFDRHPAARAHGRRSTAPPQVQIFATDIDDAGAGGRRGRRSIRRAIAGQSRPSGWSASSSSDGNSYQVAQGAARAVPLLAAQPDRAIRRSRGSTCLLPQPADLPGGGPAEEA